MISSAVCVVLGGAGGGGVVVLRLVYAKKPTQPQFASPG